MVYKVFRKGMSRTYPEISKTMLFGTFKKKSDAVMRMERMKYLEKKARKKSPDEFKEIKSEVYIKQY